MCRMGLSGFLHICGFDSIWLGVVAFWWSLEAFTSSGKLVRLLAMLMYLGSCVYSSMFICDGLYCCNCFGSMLMHVSACAIVMWLVLAIRPYLELYVIYGHVVDGSQTATF